MPAAAPRRGRSGAVTLLLFGAVFLGAQPLVTALAAGPQTVSQRGRAFSRATMEIGRGETLRFLNEDDFPHQILVSGSTVLLDSDLQSPGEVLDVAFPDTGVFAVQCGIHPRMRMSVRVR